MDGDTKAVTAILLTFIVLLFGGLIVGGIHSDRLKAASFQACVATGNSPADCASALD
jgi:hypothetical protein